MSYSIQIRRNVTVLVGQWESFPADQVPQQSGYKTFQQGNYQQVTGITAYRQVSFVQHNNLLGDTDEWLYLDGAGMQTVGLIYIARTIQNMGAPIVTVYAGGTGGTPVFSGQTDQALYDNRLIDITGVNKSFRLQITAEYYTGGSIGKTTQAFDKDVYISSTGNRLSSIELSQVLNAKLTGITASNPAPFAFSDGSDWRIRVIPNPLFFTGGTTGNVFSQFTTLNILAPTGVGTSDIRRELFGHAGVATTSQNMSPNPTSEFQGRMATQYDPSGLSLHFVVSGLTPSQFYHSSTYVFGER